MQCCETIVLATEKQFVLFMVEEGVLLSVAADLMWTDDMLRILDDTLRNVVIEHSNVNSCRHCYYAQYPNDCHLIGFHTSEPLISVLRCKDNTGIPDIKAKAIRIVRETTCTNVSRNTCKTLRVFSCRYVFPHPNLDRVHT